MKICFLIRSLKQGGSERQLLLLAGGLANHGHDVTILSFYSEADLEQSQELKRMKVRILGKRSRWHLLSFFLSAVRVLRLYDPEILQSYLSAANVLSVLMKPFLGRTRIVWGIRASNMDFAHYDWFWGFTDRIERLLARFADGHIANSQAGLTYSLGRGYPASKSRMVPNGIDTEYFKADQAAGQILRNQWGITPDEKLVGIVARLDPMKDHKTFLKAAACLLQSRPDVKFVCVGSGRPAYEKELRSLALQLGLEKDMKWVPSQSDLRGVYTAFDVFTLSSAWGEGFPNVLAEAMACEVPCVVTDVGDAGVILGDAGVLVPSANAEALAEGWKQALQMEKSEVGRTARIRIVQKYGVDQLIQNTEQVYSEILEGDH